MELYCCALLRYRRAPARCGAITPLPPLPRKWFLYCTRVQSDANTCANLMPQQVSVANATSVDPIFPYTAGPAAKGLSWYVTFPSASGDVSSMIVSTGNGPASVPGSTSASAGTLSGTDPIVSVEELQKGGLSTNMVTPEGELEVGTPYAVRVKAYNGIGWSEVRTNKPPCCCLLARRTFA